MSWSPQQDAAIKAVRDWLADKRAPQIFRLFGFAGSGKTTLAKHLAADVRGHVLYACFTGKAALVLRKKGCEGAGTIHGLIYKPQQDEVTGEYTFKLNPDSGAAYAGLVIIDEVSMVGEELARDLLSYGTKVLVLGDPAQLPPVKGEGFFINAQPDVMLTEVHRQAAENPIIRMSMDIREGRGLKSGTYGDSVVVRRADVERDWLQDRVLGADQLLCGLNRSRQTFNGRIRELKGLVGAEALWVPVPGDRLVCLRNNREKNLFNGGLWNVEGGSMSHGRKHVNTRIKSLDEEDMPPIDVSTPVEFFTGTEKDLDWKERRKADEFTYGWALTCHKAQGSQWDNVIVFDESRTFREDAAKWLYTAVTRAAERVTVVV
jgi:exodeoxyribonuclease V